MSVGSSDLDYAQSNTSASMGLGCSSQLVDHPADLSSDTATRSCYDTCFLLIVKSCCQWHDIIEQRSADDTVTMGGSSVESRTRLLRHRDTIANDSRMLASLILANAVSRTISPYEYRKAMQSS